MPLANSVNISILDKTYQISCPAEDEPLLRQAAEHLSDQMRNIRDKGSVIGSDRVAVMAALNISYEFLKLQNLEKERKEMAKRLSDMNRSVTDILRKTPIAETAQVD